jgi:argininosuccinate lyase
MTEVIRLLQVDKTEMLRQAEEGFAGATPLMEWMVTSFHLPLRKAKMAMEKAVKYSEREGKREVSFRGLERALKEMKIDLPIREEDIRKIQRPERILSKNLSTGSPSQKRMMENILTLSKRTNHHRGWLMNRKRGIEKAKAFVMEMEKKFKG